MYFHKDEKAKALERVCSKLAEHSIVLSTKQINEKLTSLKTYFGTEKRKVETASRKSGSGTDSLYRPKWQFYQSLMFLSDSFTPRATESNLSSFEGSETPNTATSRPVNSRKRKVCNEPLSPIERVLPLMETALSKISGGNKVDDFSQETHFGNLIVAMMKDIPNGEEKDMLMLRIQQDVVQTKYKAHRHPFNCSSSSASSSYILGSPTTSGYNK